MQFVICQRFLLTKDGRKSFFKDYEKLKELMVPFIPLVIFKCSTTKNLLKICKIYIPLICMYISVPMKYMHTCMGACL